MATFGETIYLNSPVWVQQVAVAAYGTTWYLRRFGGAFSSCVEELKLRNAWSESQFAQKRNQLLRSLFQAAWSSLYYRELFRSVGLSAHDMSPSVLSKLPLLTKEILRVRARDLLTSGMPRHATCFRSSGTTGTPTEIFYTREFHRTVQAFFEVRNRNWAGLTYKNRRAMFGVRKVCAIDQKSPPFWRYSPVENLAYLSIYHLSEELIPYYATFLNRFRPELVMGYPNSLFTLARAVRKVGIDIAPARAIITTSETVTDEIRTTLESVWGCKVYDNYCAVEACMLATQCEFGRYHVSPDFGLIEILDSEGRACSPGQLGEVVCTGLLNTLQPLIRYRIGDVAAWAADQNCPCRRPMPIIERIEGRVEDMCYTPAGRQVLRFDTVFKGVEGIKEAQVIQRDIDHFVIRIVPDSDFSDDSRARLVSNMTNHAGHVRTEISLVREIARTNSGKFRAVVCELSAKRKAEIGI